MRRVIGRTALALTLLGLFPALAAAQQEFSSPNTHTTFLSGPPDGSMLDVTYHVTPGQFNAAQVSLITQAAAAWSSAATGARVNLVAGGPGSDITLNNTTFTSIFLPDFVFSGPSNTTIPAGVAPDGHTLREITAASVNLLTLENGIGPSAWNNTLGAPGGTQWDFYSVILREFGIALGLGFATTDTLSVMTNAIPGPGVTRRVLSAGDIAALQHLYGTPEPATWTLFGLGLLGVGAMSRRPRPRARRPS